MESHGNIETNIQASYEVLRPACHAMPEARQSTTDGRTGEDVSGRVDGARAERMIE